MVTVLFKSSFLMEEAWPCPLGERVLCNGGTRLLFPETPCHMEGTWSSCAVAVP